MAANKDEADLERLRILVSDGKGHRLEEVTHTVTGLGHEVVGHSSLGEVAASTASIRPDAAIVIVGESSEHALELIGRTVTEAACPVIAILDVEDEAFIRDAAKRGIFAYITMGREAAALQSSLDVVLSRFAEYHGLEGAFGRRAITERAKGILMERHSVDEKLAFEMLRDEARRSNRKIIEIAEGSHRQREPASQVACRVGVGRATDVDVVVNTLTEVFDPTYEDAVVLALFILDVLLRFAAVLQTGRGHHRLGCFRAHQRSSWRST